MTDTSRPGNDHAAVLTHAVEEAARLLRADGAMIYLYEPESGVLRFARDAGIRNPVARKLIRGLSLPMGVGMFGTSAARRELVVTTDYAHDRSFTHAPVTDEIVESAGMRAMAVAPMVADGKPLGALGVFLNRPGPFDDAQLGLLRALADHAAATIANERLEADLRRRAEGLRASEQRYRFLVEQAPDVVFETDATGVFTFMSDAIERIAGWTPSEMVGQHFSRVVAPETQHIAAAEWQAVVADPSSERRADLLLIHKRGGTVPVEVRAVALVNEGVFAGIHGSTRDISDRARLEEELRAKAAELERSEERYRFLVERSPDIVYELDENANFRFLSATAELVTGWAPEEVTGRSLFTVVSPETLQHVQDEWELIRTAPLEERRLDFELLKRDGTPIAVEARGVAIMHDGRFAGVHGSVRDISERTRLESDLRRRSEELARRVEVQRTLYDIARQLTAIREPGELLQRTLNEAARLLKADGAEMDLLDEDGGGLRLAYSYARTEESPPADSPDLEHADQGIAGFAIANARVAWTGDYLNDPAFTHTPAADAWIRDNGVNSVLAAPLIGEHGPLGAILMDAQRKHAWSTEDAELLGALAAQAAVAVTNARLYKQLEHRIEAQGALSEIAAQIAAIRDSRDLLQRAIDEGVRLSGAETGAIQLLEPGTNLLLDDLAYTGSALRVADHEVNVRLGEGVAGQAVAERRVAWTGDYVNDPGFVHIADSDEWMRSRGFRSQMTAPLITGSGALGALTVYSSRREAFDADDAQLLGALANQAAVAANNTRLYAQLAGSERRYRHLVENSPDTIWSAKVDGTITFISETIERLSGWTPEELIGKHFTTLVHPDSGPRIQEEWDLLMQADQPERVVRFHLRHRDGHPVPAETTGIAELTDGRVVGAHGAVRDISVRERLEDDLREQAAELAASQTRATLARELHDSVTQALFSMGLTMRSLELLLDSMPEDAKAKLAELRELQKDALAEMRTLIFELRPKSLEQDGLEQALRTHAASVQGRTGLPVTVETDMGFPDHLPPDAEEAFYRIGQEALHNVVKHAKASSARMLLARDGRAVRLSVTDDGVGFDSSAPPPPGDHIGLVGMRQRAERIGATFSVSTRRGNGTTVSVSWPLPRDAAPAADGVPEPGNAPLAEAAASAE